MTTNPITDDRDFTDVAELQAENRRLRSDLHDLALEAGVAQAEVRRLQARQHQRPVRLGTGSCGPWPTPQTH